MLTKNSHCEAEWAGDDIVDWVICKSESSLIAARVTPTNFGLIAVGSVEVVVGYE